MIHLNKDTSTPAENISLENSLQQSFANFSKLLTFTYICATSEERDYSRHFALTIVKGKNCGLLNSVKEFMEIKASLLLNFFKFYTFHFHILNSTDV